MKQLTTGRQMRIRTLGIALAMLAMGVAPANAQDSAPIDREIVAKRSSADSKTVPVGTVIPILIDDVALRDATVIRYDGGVFRESPAGWRETRESGESHFYELIMAQENQIILYDSVHDGLANIRMASNSITISGANESATRSYAITAMEAVTRTYQRPARFERDAYQLVTFEGGELRRSLFGRWIRRDDNGECTIYRLLSTYRRSFSIWDEENDIVLSVNTDTLRMGMGPLGHGGWVGTATHRITAVSGIRNANPLQDCNDAPNRLNAEDWQEDGTEPFPLETFGYDSGQFSRMDNGQWQQLPGHNDRSVSGTPVINYDVVDTSADRLILFNEEYGLHALVELRFRSLSLFTMNGVVDQFYPITTTNPAFGWETAAQRRSMTASDMVTADYDGGQFVMTARGRWIDNLDSGGCVTYREWSRDFTGFRLHAPLISSPTYRRIDIDATTMTATLYRGFLPDGSAPEIRQLTAIGTGPISDRRPEGC